MSATTQHLVLCVHPHLMSCVQAFLDSDATELTLDSAAFEGSHLSLAPAMQSNALPVNASLRGIAQQLHARNTFRYVLAAPEPLRFLKSRVICGQ